MYRMLALDLDGTLIAPDCPQIAQKTVQALQAAQAQGVQVVLATGRARFAVTPEILNGLVPDYFICAGGALVLDSAGEVLLREEMSREEMYALVDFCEDYDYPLAFSFTDGYYVYTEYERLRAYYATLPGQTAYLYNGENQDHHLQGMPLAAFCDLPRAEVVAFAARYGHLGLRFLFYDGTHCDVVREHLDKSMGLAALMTQLNLCKEELVAVGDGANDCGMLALADLGVCVENGCDELKAVAQKIVPPVRRQGVAALTRELWP